jgi:hypothetical protein
MSRLFWRTLSLLPSCFMVINFFITNMDNMKRGSPLLSHLQAKGRVDHLGGLLFALAHY